MQAHQLGKSKTRTQTRRGRGGKRGTTSGRGTKGQKARSGRRIRPQVRDIIKKVHKRRGHGKNRADSNNPNRKRQIVVSMRSVEKKFKEGELVTSALLIERGLVDTRRKDVKSIKLIGLPSKMKFTFDKNITFSTPSKQKNKK
jgi:large subunit ribosomal protein L15